ncbi:MAG TPA: tetratricopeptide repeat protein [Vicinamibacterales bacterium]|nr:tetratricopeptide repeat protein [Vicinamibacterales bacterium]
MSRGSRPKTKAAQPSKPVRREWWRPGNWWRAGVILAAGFLVYANSLSSPFVLDDNDSIVNNPAVRQLSTVGAVLLQYNTPIAGRPAVAASFALDYALGGLAVRAYHVTNVGVHLLCALLLFGVVRRTLKLPRLADRYRRAADNLGLAIALIWVVHPLNSEAVDYVTQRTESMMALFLLLTLYAAIRSVTCSRKAMWASISVVSCALGMACKESMVVAPVIVFLYDRIFLFDSLRAAFAARWRLYGALATTWLLLAYFMLPGPRSGSVGTSTLPSTMQPTTYLLNQARMVARYFRLSIWPSGLVVDYGPVAAVHLRDVAPQALFIAIAITATLIALVRCPPLGFPGAWIFITLAPTSSVIPIATEVGAERRMYLPLMAVSALLVAGAYSVPFIRRRLSERAAMATLAAVVLALGAATMVRNREYASGLSLAESALRRWPTDVAHGMVGSELSALHRDNDAVAELRIAARSDPRSRYNLGVTLFNMGRLDEAIVELKGMADEHPLMAEVPSARRIMAQAYALEHNWPKAINEATLSLSMAPRNAETLKLLADNLNNQGLELAGAGKFDQAVPLFRRAAAAEPQRSDLRHNLAAALFDNHDPAASEREARQAVALDSTDAGSYDLLGRALAVQGKIANAIAQFEQALRLAPNDPQFNDDLNRVQRLKSQSARTSEP